ncbi:hypothetical protein [Candidatus Sodalis pierantonius]|uniref:hypothetical protein n=1 Tax=Candidatus Sodalis pierantonii TaxID=1486991 RepID=UPI0004B7FC82|nr:hypothetical protein [Candidatus Sodalis pierantonius]
MRHAGHRGRQRRKGRRRVGAVGLKPGEKIGGVGGQLRLAVKRHYYLIPIPQTPPAQARQKQRAFRLTRIGTKGIEPPNPQIPYRRLRGQEALRIAKAGEMAHRSAARHLFMTVAVLPIALRIQRRT